jgi:hypothetical protein
LDGIKDFRNLHEDTLTEHPSGGKLPVKAQTPKWSRARELEVGENELAHGFGSTYLPACDRYKRLDLPEKNASIPCADFISIHELK